MIRQCRKFVNAFRNRGIKESLAIVKRYWMAKEIEELETTYGLDLKSIVDTTSLDCLGDNQPDGFFYSPSSPRLVRMCLRQLGTDLSSTTFVDIGSGKGLVLLIASQFGFKELIGVEYARELHEIAQQNCHAYFRQFASINPPLLLHQDATQVAYPKNDSVFYFCNPFSERVMQATLDNIFAGDLETGTRFRFIIHQLMNEDNESRADGIFELFESDTRLQSVPFHGVSRTDRFLLADYRIRMFETMAKEMMD